MESQGPEKLNDRDDDVDVSWTTLFDAFPDGALLVGESGRIQRASANFCAKYGFNEDELLHQSIESLVPNESRTHHTFLRSEFHKGRNRRPMAGHREVELLDHAGVIRTVDLSLVRLDSDGYSSVIALIRDIALEHHLAAEVEEERDGRLEAIRQIDMLNSTFSEFVLSSSNQCCIVDSMGIIAIANASMRSRHQLLHANPVGQSLVELIHPDDRRTFTSLLAQAFREGESVGPQELRFVPTEGAGQTLSVSLMVIQRAENFRQTEVLCQIVEEQRPSDAPQVPQITSGGTVERSLSSDPISALRSLAQELTHSVAESDCVIAGTAPDGSCLIFAHEGSTANTRASHEPRVPPWGPPTLPSVLADALATSRIENVATLVRGIENELGLHAIFVDHLESDGSERAAILLLRPWGHVPNGSDIDAVRALVGSFRPIFELYLEASVGRIHRNMLEASSARLIVTDLACKIIYSNQDSLRELANLGEHVLLDAEWDTFIDSLSSDARVELITETERRGFWSREVDIHRKDDAALPMRIKARPLRSSNGTAYAIAFTVKDLTSQREVEDLVARQITYDSLTNLPNRSLFLSRLTQMLRWSASTTGVILLNIERFRAINESKGHAIGDELLNAISKRLVVNSRLGEVLARTGSDEFAIAASHLSVGGTLESRRKEIFRLFEVPFNLSGHDIYLASKVGISAANASSTPEGLLSDAQSEMRSARLGASSVPSGNSRRTQTSDWVELESALRRAIQAREFEVYFQPQTLLSDESIIGAEALIRWRKDGVNFTPPDEFLPVAESTGLMTEIGALVLETACATLSGWRTLVSNLTMSINVSSYQLLDTSFNDFVRTTLDRHGLPAGSVILELTETAFMGDIEAVAERLNELLSSGISFAIDDFGTGYSSLTYLRKLPFVEMKLDKSYVQGIGVDEDDEAIVASMLGLAASLKMTSIAEGVETIDQRDRLIEMGCRKAQGYLYGRPMAATEFELLLLAASKSPPLESVIVERAISHS